MATDLVHRINLARTGWAGIHYAASINYLRNTANDFRNLYR